MQQELLNPSEIDFANPIAKIVYLWKAWMLDRDLMRENNTEPKVLELLRAEINEFFQAHRDKHLESEKFDEIPGELADILIFAVTWYLVRDMDPTLLLEEIYSEAIRIQTSSRISHPLSQFVFEHLYMARIEQAMGRIESSAPDEDLYQEAQMGVLLRATFQYALLHDIDLMTETPEKIAFDDVRYTSKQFTLGPDERYTLELYNQRRRAAKDETKKRKWKETFYEISAAQEQGYSTSQSPRSEKRAKRISALKLAIGQYAGALFALL